MIKIEGTEIIGESREKIEIGIETDRDKEKEDKRIEGKDNVKTKEIEKIEEIMNDT